MKIEEAMVWLLSTQGCGMSADRLAREINARRLHVRRDGTPVTEAQIWAHFFKYPEIFVRDGRLIRLLM